MYYETVDETLSISALNYIGFTSQSHTANNIIEE